MTDVAGFEPMTDLENKLDFPTAERETKKERKHDLSEESSRADKKDADRAFEREFFFKACIACEFNGSALRRDHSSYSHLLYSYSNSCLRVLI